MTIPRQPGAGRWPVSIPAPEGVGVEAGLPATLVSAATVKQALARARRHDYGQWIEHVRHVGDCTRPVRLTGRQGVVDTQTGAIVHAVDTAVMPDGELYKACGNRRASVCPACAEVYRADTYQLIHAGISGGKGIPATVREHPFAFVTLTAPSFGPVHSLRARDGRARRCRPRRRADVADVCAHGRPVGCHAVHTEGDQQLGQPLCLDCYDHDHQVVFNAMSGELWRRTTATLAKHLRKIGVRASFGKVAEMQARGVVHFHAIIRLDALDPDLRTAVGPDGLERLAEVPAPPPAWVTVAVLKRLLTGIVASTSFDSPPHTQQPDGWPIAWGAQLDVRPVRAVARQQLGIGIGTGPIAETAVAGYLAKYATKATETTGHVSTRISPATVGRYADLTTHPGRLIEACWRLGHPAADLDPAAAVKNSGRLSYTRLRRWAHMLGFGGHFSTKSRRYSVTLGRLRGARITYRRDASNHRRHQIAPEPDTTLLVGSLTFAGIGWHTTGDALLANTAAVQAREHRRVAREESRHLDQLTARDRASTAA